MVDDSKSIEKINAEMRNLWENIWESFSKYRRAGVALSISIGTLLLSEAYFLYQLLKDINDRGFQFWFCFIVLLSAITIFVLCVIMQFFNYFGQMHDAHAAIERYKERMFYHIDNNTGNNKSYIEAGKRADDLQVRANKNYGKADNCVMGLVYLLPSNGVLFILYITIFIF